jgi:hypothetical protein
MIKAEEAERLARDTIRSLAGTNENDFSLQEEKTVEHSAGWVFFYNSLQYIQTGNPIYMLAGNGPIFVEKSGKVTILPSHSPLEESVQQLVEGH